MTPKILFASTLVLALISSAAMAQEARPLSRADVVADYQRGAANGTLRKNDYDYAAHDRVAAGKLTRDEVVADMDASRKGNTLVGPMRNRTYNAYGTEMTRPSVVTRGEVKTQVSGALRDGSLRHSDYDDVPVSVARRVARERAAARNGS